MPVSINGTNGLVFPDGSTQGTAAPGRNKLINGACMIDQRNAGASVSLPNYTVDRFPIQITQGSGHTTQRSTNAPAGFVNSAQVTIGTGASPAAGSLARMYQAIEGLNIADLGWGTASAQPVTLSFWVRSSLTGTFAGGLYNGSSNRTYVFTYLINAANTWEKKSVTIAGDTTGTWATDNTGGIYVNWDLGTGSTYQGTANTWAAGAAWATSGSVKLAATSGATFFITGMQLEKGTAASDFDFRSYGTELQLCQRYYFRNTPGSIYSQLGFFGTAGNTSSIVGPAMMPVIMRTTPTVTTSNARLADGANGLTFSAITIAWNGAWATELTFSVTGATQYRPYYLQNNNSASGYIDFSAEL